MKYAEIVKIVVASFLDSNKLIIQLHQRLQPFCIAVGDYLVICSVKNSYRRSNQWEIVISRQMIM